MFPQSWAFWIFSKDQYHHSIVQSCATLATKGLSKHHLWYTFVEGNIQAGQVKLGWKFVFRCKLAFAKKFSGTFMMSERSLTSPLLCLKESLFLSGGMLSLCLRLVNVVEFGSLWCFDGWKRQIFGVGLLVVLALGWLGLSIYGFEGGEDGYFEEKQSVCYRFRLLFVNASRFAIMVKAWLK